MSDTSIRLSDAEREAVAADLGEHFAQGRLTADEHAERLDQAWSARTRADLVPLFRDLPDPARRTPEPGRGRAGRRPEYWAPGPPWRGPVPGPFLVVLVALLVLTVVTHVPFILAGVLVAIFVASRRRRMAWDRRWPR